MDFKMEEIQTHYEWNVSRWQRRNFTLRSGNSTEMETAWISSVYFQALYTMCLKTDIKYLWKIA